MQTKKYTKKDFEWVNWTPKDINRVVEEALKEKKSRYANIKSISKEDRTFANTVYALESSDYGAVEDMNKVYFLMNASPRKTVRTAAQIALNKFEKAMVDIEFDKDIYQAFKEYKPKRGELKDPDKKLFDDMTRSYKRMGFELDAAKQRRLKQILKKQTVLGTKFSKNINDYKDHITVGKNDTEGLPKNYLAGLKKDKKGNYIVTLDYPDSIPFMENAKSEENREKLSLKLLQKGGQKNLKILEELVKLRAEHAGLLGYKSHAAFVTEVRMAKSPENIQKFITELIKPLKPKLKKESIELRNAKRKLTKNKKAELKYHDRPYYSNQLKKQKFNIDDEEVREYFPLEIVLKGTLEIYSKLLSVKFVELKNHPTWHKDVLVYAVKNKKDTIAYFYLDLHPREDKYGHAAVFGLTKGKTTSIDSKAKYIPPVAAMLTNFKKPTKTSPSLLSHGEVETFFHEFGHVVHQALTKAKYSSQSGTSVAGDFVEAPSQMLEHWVWNEKMLKILSGHYKDHSKKLPKETLKNMLAAKNHMIANATMRQLVFASFDMAIHTDKGRKSIPKIYDELVLKLTGLKMPKNIWPAGFGHMVGYNAGYYGYMWSKVYAVDMFTRFEKEGLLNKRVGADYRKWILEKGSSMDEMDLVKKFLGRKPNNKAFLKEIGL